MNVCVLVFSPEKRRNCVYIHNKRKKKEKEKDVSFHMTLVMFSNDSKDYFPCSLSYITLDETRSASVKKKKSFNQNG
jgi:hypothetical protein